MVLEIVIILLTLSLCLFVYVNERNQRSKLPPGEYGWPIIGNIPSRNKSIHKYIEEYRRKYGNIFIWRMGSVNFLFLCDFPSVKSAFTSAHFQSRPHFFTLKTITFDKMIGLINGIGVKWQNTRKFTLRHLRNRGMGKTTMEDTITNEIEGLIADFKKHTNHPTEIPISINAAVMNVLWRLVAAKRYEIDSKETQFFQQSLTDAFNFSQGDLILFDLLPWLVPLTPRFVKDWFGYREYKRSLGIIFSLLKSVVEEHKKNLSMDEPRDVVEAYLQEMKLYQEEGKGDYGSTFDEEDLQSVLLDMFAAGSDSTSHTIRWNLLYLAQHVDVQNKIQKEIDDHIPRDKFPTLADKEKLPYTEASYHEVMRIMPQIPLGLYHATSDDAKLFDYVIPKGTVVVSSIQSCHLDPKYWENPLEFRPERFLNPDGTFNGKLESFLPFSIGRRYCLGESLARMEVFLVTTSLLQNFTFSAPKGESINLEPDPKQPLFNIPSTIKVTIRVREEPK